MSLKQNTAHRLRNTEFDYSNKKKCPNHVTAKLNSKNNTDKITLTSKKKFVNIGYWSQKM